jgi:hypothetical protein
VFGHVGEAREIVSRLTDTGRRCKNLSSRSGSYGYNLFIYVKNNVLKIYKRIPDRV